jgi:multicomponent Na+:H+ antiporter subunit D
MADVAQLLPVIYQSPAILAGAAFIILGLGIKMALFPLHMWLPDAHSYAPPIIAAILASVQIEVPAYVLVRLFLDVFPPGYLSQYLPVTTIIGWCAVVGIIVGSIMAIAQKDFKRMLAYSTVSQVAYIGLGIALANPLGLIGALLHILNHAFMKSCLFLTAGGTRWLVGIREITWFTGLGRRMPFLMSGFTIAALSMVGIPPTAGFFSKWYLVLGSIDASNWVFVAVILASSLLNAVYFFRVIERVWAHAPPEGVEANGGGRIKPSPRILAPVLILAAGVLILGLINAFIVIQVLDRIVAPLR